MFAQWFCKHKWKSHEKKVYEYDKFEVVPGSMLTWEKHVERVTYSNTVEIMICEKCGKIKELNY